MPLDHFNLIAGLYDRAGQFIASDQLLDLLSLSPNQCLLDAGGGTGRVAAALRGMVKEVFVVDISRDMLKRSAGKGLPTVYSPVEWLPFPSESIDRIIMMDALHHVKNHQLTARELWRVLSPGGRLLIEEPDIQKLSVKAIAFVEKLVLMRSHFLNSREIASLFSSSEAKCEVIFDELTIFFIAEKVR